MQPEKQDLRHVLDIDIETRSEIDLGACGIYRYVESDSFTILLCGFSLDGGTVEEYDLLSGDELPQWFLDALSDPNFIKVAHNAQFERICFSKYLYGNLDRYLDPGQWRCSMAHSLYVGLPGKLVDVGKALSLGDDKQKLSTGQALITYFSKPSKTRGRLWNMPWHDIKRWELYMDYNVRDVESEMEIERRLSICPIPGKEQKIYALDQRMNDRGVLLDMQMVNNILTYNDSYQAALIKRAKELTGLTNPNSNSQLLGWLQERDASVTSVDKEAREALAMKTTDPLVKEVLVLKQKMARSSLKKYDTMKRAVCKDGRIRGVLLYYGANRTGRWAGRLVQVQNLPRNNINEIDAVRDLVKQGDWETLECIYDDLPDILSQLIRTSFIAPPGKTYVVCDYSAIEARVIAWLSGEKWRQDVFAGDGKIYEASAAQMFHVPIEQVTKGSDLRKKGKVAELALGYQGGVGAMLRMGGDKMGLSEEEMADIVKKWRKASPHICALWRNIEECAKNAITTHRPQKLKNRDVSFIYEKGCLFVILPSKRRLVYQHAIVNGEGRYAKISFMGMHQEKKIWYREDTYGGKLTENIVQAIARDCLAEALLSLDGLGYDIVFHVHDEVIIEVDADKAQEEYDLIKDMMCMKIPWAPGLILNAEGFTNPYYMKD